jgi:hypothetical protein
MSYKTPLLAAGLILTAIVAAFFLYWPTLTISGGSLMANIANVTQSNADQPNVTKEEFDYPPLDKVAYDAAMTRLANVPVRYVRVRVSSSTTSTVLIATSTPSAWPVKTAPYPLGGALLPFNRIVAYYGNFYSTQMGVLGEYPPDQMIQMLKNQAAEWQAADTSTPVIPALDYIAVAAQDNPSPDGLYRLRMPADQIQKAIDLANRVNGIVILDIQIGLSTVEKEVPLLEPYLQLPQVHLALDSEFSMRKGGVPGGRIGTMDAADINYAIQYLAKIVDENHLPPKILVIHLFTDQMVTNWQDIKPLPEVEVVMDMDGFGTPFQKVKIYNDIIAAEPVQFTGIKLFYKNDLLQPGSYLMTPADVLKLSPQPSFIQYQ